jgi:hypothetical protein
MPLTRIEPEASLSFPQQQPVVCIPVYGGFEVYVQCVQSVLSDTPKTVPILVADDASRDERIAGFLDELAANDALAHDVS